jgi:hypothetical protein
VFYKSSISVVPVVEEEAPVVELEAVELDIEAVAVALFDVDVDLKVCLALVILDCVIRM